MDKQNITEQILSTMQFRHACKEFDPDQKISAADFQTILEVGRLSPSSFGLEPWKFLVIQDPNVRAALAGISWGGKKQIPTASHLMVLLAKKRYYLEPGSDYTEDMMTNLQQLPPDVLDFKRKAYRKFHESDMKLAGEDRVLFNWACRQTYIALGNMLTAAALLKIDSCPLEGMDHFLVNDVLAETIGLDTEKYGVSCMVTFGYRIREPRSKTRRPMDQVVEWIR